jgi:hypothetical protein
MKVRKRVRKKDRGIARKKEREIVGKKKEGET